MQFVRLELENYCSVQLSYGADVLRSFNDLLMARNRGPVTPLLVYHKSGRGLWGVAFGVMQVTPEADVQDRRVGRRVRNSPEERCIPRGRET